MNGDIGEQSAHYDPADLNPLLDKASGNNTLLDSLNVWLSAQTTKSAGRGRSAENTHQYGLQKLRELILELAVRGKLVPQDPNDESANVLLEKVVDEKKLLISSGEIKRGKVLPEVTHEESFSHPSNWALVRYGKITSVTTGKLDANAAVDNGTYPFFTCSRTPSQIDEYAFDCEAILLAGNGDFNLKMYQGKFNAYQRTYVIRPILMNTRFLYYLTFSQIDRITENHRGSAIPYLKLADITDPVVAIPPLPEQHRIVKKVDELMALCDQLEQQQTDVVQAHDTIIKVLLDILIQSDNADDFQQNWHRIAEHFGILFTTESSIDQLKQTLLQLAVMGKLVPQDPSDEPASVLLEKIADEKARLIKDGIIKKQKPLPAVSEDEKRYTLPSGWQWARLADYYDVRDGTHDTPKYTNEGYPLVTSKNLSSGGLDFSDIKFISESDHIKIIERSKVDSGDILFAMIGSIGNAVIVNTKREFSIKNVALFKYYSSQLSVPHFLLTFLRFAESVFKEQASGAVQSFVSLGKIRNFPIAIPPVSEQLRIVKKVDELIALCDQLKNRLNHAQTLQQQLADAVVETTITKD